MATTNTIITTNIKKEAVIKHEQIEEVTIKEEEYEIDDYENEEQLNVISPENNTLPYMAYIVDVPKPPHTKDVEVQVPSRNEIYNHGFMSIIKNYDYIYLSGYDRNEIQSMFHVLKLHHKDYSVYEDFLFITLTIYKHKFPFRMAACLFQTTVINIRKIIEDSTNALYDSLKNYDFWQHRQKKPLKYNFILNCVEIPVIESDNFLVRQLTKSLSVWNRHTFKFLVVTDERDYVMYCSDLYGGCTSGRKIFIESDVLSKCNANDYILCDKEFIIHDILMKCDIGMDVALFVNSKSTCNIVRAHRTLQSYNILNMPMEPDLWHLANRIAFNCFMLTNFKKGPFWNQDSAINNLLISNKTMNLCNKAALFN